MIALEEGQASFGALNAKASYSCTLTFDQK